MSHLSRHPMRLRRALLSSLAALLVVVGCATPPIPQPVVQEVAASTDLQAVDLGGGKLRVVATTNIVADVVANIGGDHIELTALMGPGVDPHGYQLTPGDRRLLEDAHVVFVNGLGLEEGVLPFLADLDSGAPVVTVNAGIETIEFMAAHDHDHEAHDHEAHDHEAHDHEHVDVMRRVLVADAKTATVTVVDLPGGEIAGTLDLSASARLYAAEDGRYVYAVQADADLVNVIDGGLWTEDHGDHMHDYLVAPSLAAPVISGGRPIHFVSHHGQVAIFFDGDGTAAIFSGARPAQESEIVLLDSGRPHHGVAVPLGDHALLSLPTNDDAVLPLGVQLMTLAGEVVAEFADCPGLHGEAPLGDWVAFGCTDGVLLVDAHHDEPVAVKVAKPVDDPDRRTGTLISHHDLPYWIGNFGSRDLVRIDADTLETTLIPLPGASAGFQLDPADGGRIVVVTLDGLLHTLDPMTGDLLGSVAVATPIPADAPRGTPRPGLAVDPGVAYVTDPAAGLLHVVDLDALAVTLAVEVGGTPSPLTVVGLPVSHEHAHGEDHAHGEGHHHHHDGDDPHTWFSVPVVMAWTANIADALAALDPANAEAYAAAAENYRSELAELDAEIRAMVATLPAERRKLVTDHDSFGYYAAEYGFEVIGAVIPAFSTLAAPSAQDLARLQDQIRAEGVPAIFVGTTVNPSLAERLAQDLGIRVVMIYHGALSDAAGTASTYIAMMRYNTQAIVDALR